MKELFFQILEMSLSANWLVLAVILLRFALKKAPKYIHCILWVMVALRLICPALPESQASLIPDNKPIASVVLAEQGNTANIDPNQLVQLPSNLPQSAPLSQSGQKSLEWGAVFSAVWLAGVAVMTAYGAVSYLLLRRKVAPSIKEDGVWLCDDVASPFILGIFRPRIYLPSSLSDDCRESVLAHEQAHLRRKDHWWKPLGFVLLSIHWFNPVMWLAYILLCRDIEGACDERVIKGMDAQARKQYSEALLYCAMPRQNIAACPLAFGEQGIKGRIKSVMNYKKPAIWIIIAAVVLSTVVAVCFLTDPKTEQSMQDNKLLNTKELEELRQEVPEYFMLGTFKGIEVYVWEHNWKLYCGAMSGTNLNKSDEEVQALVGVPLEAMALILDTYNIPDWYISVVPTGRSSRWTQDQTGYGRLSYATKKQLRDELGLYTLGDGEITMDLTIGHRGEKELVFGDGFFYAMGHDGLYKVMCSDMADLKEGMLLSVACANKEDVIGNGLGSAEHIVTANKIFVMRDPELQAGTVYFDLYDEPVVSGLIYKQTSTRYRITVTKQELDILTAIADNKKWREIAEFDSILLYEGSIVVDAYGFDVKRSTAVLCQNGIVQGTAYASLTQEERLLLEDLKSRAAEVQYNSSWASSGAYVSQGTGEYVSLSYDRFRVGDNLAMSNGVSGTAQREEGRVILTTTDETPQIFVFNVLRHMLIYDKDASSQTFLDIRDETVFYLNM